MAQGKKRKKKKEEKKVRRRETVCCSTWRGKQKGKDDTVYVYVQDSGQRQGTSQRIRNERSDAMHMNQFFCALHPSRPVRDEQY